MDRTSIAPPHLSYGEHNVWITVDRKFKGVRHYPVSFEELSRTSTCWIPCEEDKSFAVCGQNAVGEHDYALVICLDGHPCSSHHMPKGWAGERSVSYDRTSTTEVRGFKFGILESTDNVDYLERSARKIKMWAKLGWEFIK